MLTLKKSSRLSIDNYFHFFGMSVYLSGNNGLQVIVKDWIPKRLKGLEFSGPYYFDCPTFTDACNLFYDLCMELLHYVKSGI